MVTKAWRSAVVRIFERLAPSQAAEFVGSAFLVSPRMLLTCRHVVDNRRKDSLILEGPCWTQPHKVSYVHVHPTRDIAVLVVSSSHDLIADPILPSRDMDGRLTTAGYTAATTGLETAPLDPKAYDAEVDALVLHTHIGRGISGGPVISNDNFIGVVQARNINTAKTYLIPFSAFGDFVADVGSTIGEVWPITGRADKLSILSPLPANYVKRDTLLEQVKTGILSRTGVVGLVGLGGIGKTTIALATARDREIQDHFIDGVLWGSISSSPSLLPILQGWIARYSENAASFVTIDDAVRQLQNILRDKRVLVILDDVWSQDAVDQLVFTGETGCTLVTSRDRRCFSGVPVSLIEVGELERASSAELVRLKLATNSMVCSAVATDELCDLLGDLPLALNIAAAILCEGVDVEILIDGLKVEIGRLRALSFEVPSASQKDFNVDASLNLSLDRLSPRDKTNLLYLATLRSQEEFEAQVAGIIWECSALETQKGLALLHSKSLISRVSDLSAEAAYKMHDLVRDRCLTILLEGDMRTNSSSAGAYFEDGDALQAWPAQKYHLAMENAGSWSALELRGYSQRQLFYHLNMNRNVSSMLEIIREEKTTLKNSYASDWYVRQESSGGFAQYVVDLTTALKLSESMIVDFLSVNRSIAEDIYTPIEAFLSASITLSSAISQYTSISSDVAKILVDSGVWRPVQAASMVERCMKTLDLLLFSLDLPAPIRRRLNTVAVYRMAHDYRSCEEEGQRTGVFLKMMWATFFVSDETFDALLRLSEAGFQKNGTDSSCKLDVLNARYYGFVRHLDWYGEKTPLSVIDSALKEALTSIEAVIEQDPDCVTNAGAIRGRAIWALFGSLHSICREKLLRRAAIDQDLAAIECIVLKLIEVAGDAYVKCRFRSMDLQLFIRIIPGGVDEYLSELDAKLADLIDFLKDEPKVTWAHLESSNQEEIMRKSDEAKDTAIAYLALCAFGSEQDLAAIGRAMRYQGERDHFPAMCFAGSIDWRAALAKLPLSAEQRFVLAASVSPALQPAFYAAACEAFERLEAIKSKSLFKIESHLDGAAAPIFERLARRLAELRYVRASAYVWFRCYSHLSKDSKNFVMSKVRIIGDPVADFMIVSADLIASRAQDDENAVANLMRYARSLSHVDERNEIILRVANCLPMESLAIRSLVRVCLENADGMGDEEAICRAIGISASQLSEPARQIVLSAPPICTGKTAVVLRTADRRNFASGSLLKAVEEALRNGSGIRPSLIPEYPLLGPSEEEWCLMSDKELIETVILRVNQDLEFNTRAALARKIADFTQEISVRGHANVAAKIAVALQDCYRWWG